MTTITNKSTCRILWSTQSGRAKACARRSHRILSEQTTLTFVDSIGSSFDETPEPFLDWVGRMKTEDEFLLLFVSTTGDGEHCDSIRQTWEALLSKALPKNTLQGKQFAIYCLGDRAYGPQFCAAGRKLAVRLLQLGMTNCCEVGYGDDNTPNGGVFRDLDDWLETSLLPILEKSAREGETFTSAPPSPFRISLLDGSEQVTSGVVYEWQDPLFQQGYQDFFTSSSPLTAYRYDARTQRMSDSLPKGNKQVPLLGTVVINERITASDWEQDTRHICIQLTSTTTTTTFVPDVDSEASPLPYQAGDIATVLPFNSMEVVNRFLSVLPRRIHQMADQPIEVIIDDSRMNNAFCHWPKRFTLRGWLSYCADIHSLPEREDLRALSVYCSTEHPMGKDQREKLQSLAEVSEAALYADYVLREKRSWTDVLYDFESLSVESSELSIEALLTLLPAMRPRDFSIASAPSHGTTHRSGSDVSIELCVAGVKGTTRLGRPYHGLCSEFLSRMMVPPTKDGQEEPPPLLQLWIRPGSFGKLPLDLHAHSATFQIPIMCVGAGTGVAPMRSLLLERAARAALVSSTSGSGVGQRSVEDESTCKSILVFGCRKSSADFYYKDEWAQLSEEGQLRLLTAFSRDQYQKIYVQKVVREADQGSLIARHLLENEGALYIAGGPQMARAVKEEVMEVLSKELPGGEKEAKAFLRKLQRLGKFSIEAWN